MPNYHLTPDAQSDVIGIRRYTLKQWGEVQSKKYLLELRLTFRLLSETPLLGIARPDIGDNVRSFPYVSHVIYYLVHNQQLVVFGILHMRMVPLEHLDKRKIV